MKDDWGPLRAPFLGGFGIGIAIGVFMLLIAPAFTLQTYCVEGETVISCWREWSMMFATWAAAVVGVGAAYFVYQTIVKMNEQISEARRQTSFLLGEDLPSVEIIPHTDYGQPPTFRVINWNRSQFSVAEVKWLDEPKLACHGRIHEGGRLIRMVLPSGVLTRKLAIMGWEDRNSAPPAFEGEFILCPTEDPLGRVGDREFKDIRLEIVGFLGGQRKAGRIHVTALGTTFDVDIRTKLAPEANK